MSHNSDSRFSENSFSQENGAFPAVPVLNSRQQIMPAVPGQQEFIESMLSGSQKKTAYAIRLNAERMIREGGLNSTGFFDADRGRF